MKKKVIKLMLKIALGTFALLFAACYPEEPQKIDELDVVQTQYDKDFSFNSKSYYLLPDSVAVITDNAGYVKTKEETALDQSILDEISNRMNDDGYQRLSLADTSNDTLMSQAVIILPSRSTVVYSNQYYDYYYYGYDYWDWYYGLDYYYPGYSTQYYYPWGYPVTYSYAVGTVIIEMVDPEDPVSVDDQNHEVSYNVRWMAILNGLAETSVKNTQERVTNGIDQAFDQSPYLNQSE